MIRFRQQRYLVRLRLENMNWVKIHPFTMVNTFLKGLLLPCAYFSPALLPPVPYTMIYENMIGLICFVTVMVLVHFNFVVLETTPTRQYQMLR